MKLFTNFFMSVTVASTILISCKKDNKNTTNQLPTPVNSVVTQAELDSLSKHGMAVYKGTTPPTIDGTFLIHPDKCTYDGSTFGDLGLDFDDYYYRFSNQNNSKYTIRFDFETPNGTDRGSDTTATFISGSGNNFTIFAQTNGVLDGIQYTALRVLSGTIASTGMVNLQTAYYEVNNGSYTGNNLVKPGTLRLFADSDKFSEKVTNVVFPDALNQVKTSLNSLNTTTSSMPHLAMGSAKKD